MPSPEYVELEGAFVNMLDNWKSEEIWFRSHFNYLARFQDFGVLCFEAYHLEESCVMYRR